MAQMNSSSNLTRFCFGLLNNHVKSANILLNENILHTGLDVTFVNEPYFN